MWKYLMILVIIIEVGCMNEKGQPRYESKERDLSEFEYYEKIDKERDTIDLKKLALQFQDKNTPFRQNALVKLNKRNYSKIKELLESSLSDEDKNIKIIAIQKIKEKEQIESIEILMEMFKNSNDHLILSNLCKAFAEFQDTKPIPILLDKLDSKNDMIIYDCVWTLGEIGTNSELKILEELKLNIIIPEVNDDNGLLSQSSIYTIGQIAEKSIEKIRKKEASR